MGSSDTGVLTRFTKSAQSLISLMTCDPKYTGVGRVQSCQSGLHTSFLKFSVSSSCGYWLVAFEHESLVSVENLSNYFTQSSGGSRNPF